MKLRKLENKSSYESSKRSEKEIPKLKCTTKNFDLERKTIKSKQKSTKAIKE